MQNNLSDFTVYLQSPLRERTRVAIAARRSRLQDPADSSSPAVKVDADADTGIASAPPAEFDLPTDAQFETLDITDVISRCIDQVGYERFKFLSALVAAARGERE